MYTKLSNHTQHTDANQYTHSERIKRKKDDFVFYLSFSCVFSMDFRYAFLLLSFVFVLLQFFSLVVCFFFFSSFSLCNVHAPYNNNNNNACMWTYYGYVSFRSNVAYLFLSFKWLCSLTRSVFLSLSALSFEIWCLLRRI